MCPDHKDAIGGDYRDAISVSELRQRRPVVKKRRPQTRAQRELEAEARENFKREVLRLDMGRCIGATAFGSQHECPSYAVHYPSNKPFIVLQAHHCVPQPDLRDIAGDRELTEEETIALLWDPDLAATVCAGPSGLHESHTCRLLDGKPFRIPFEWLPARVVDCASALELLPLLEREHPRSVFAPGD